MPSAFESEPKCTRPTANSKSAVISFGPMPNEKRQSVLGGFASLDGQAHHWLRVLPRSQFIVGGISACMSSLSRPIGALQWDVDGLPVLTSSRPCQGFLMKSLGMQAWHMMQSRSFASHRLRPSCNCWLNIAGAEIHSALYVPPSSSVSREECHGIVLSYFQEWDTVVSEVSLTDQRTTSHTLMSGCGDLNMTPDLKLLFESCLQDRGLWWATQLTAATHVKGGILDFLWCERGNAKPPPILHDGRVCRSRGCQNPLCGNLADATASKDLDHDAWTFVTCLTKLPGAETAFSLYFSKDADMWECAVHTMGRQVMELLALDQSTALQSCRV